MTARFKQLAQFIFRKILIHSYICRSKWLYVIFFASVLVFFGQSFFPSTDSSLKTPSHMIELVPEPNFAVTEIHDTMARFSILDRENPLCGLPVSKKIHFMYREYKINKHFKPLLWSWRKVYPDYKMYFWTDAEIDLLIKRLYPAWTDMYYSQLSNYLERSDTARAFVLHSMGGWYADLDTGCLSRADGLASRHALILPLEPYFHAVNNFRMRRLVSNAIMYSAAGHPFWEFYLHRLRQSLIGMKPRESTLRAVFTTGPVLLTKLVTMFNQASRGLGCPGPWCPHTPPPVQFLPLYDNNTQAVIRFRFLCTRTGLERLVDFPEFYDECSRFAPHNYENHPLDPTDTYSYHEFVHLNEKQYNGSEVDVRQFGLRLFYGADLVAEINSLQYS